MPNRFIELRAFFVGLVLTLICSPSLAQTNDQDHPHDRHSADHHPHHHGVPGELPDRYPDRITLNWSQDPATSLSVTWRTDTTVEGSFAEIAPARAEPTFTMDADSLDALTEVLDLSHVVGEDVQASYHSATFTGLDPGTLYAYRVGNAAYRSEWFHARTALDTPGPLTFIYFGDAQNLLRSHWSRAIRAAFQQEPDASFIIHAGDLVDQAHRNLEWGEWHQAGGFIHSMLPSLPVPGNHEYDDYGDEGPDRLSAHWRPGFTLPMNGASGFKETTYYLDLQDVRVIGLDSDPATSYAEALDVQTQWLDSVLTHNPNTWTVVTFHHPIFASGSGRDNRTLREAWKPLLDQHRVDLVLQGHDHSYARGRATNVVSGLNARSPVAGTVYVNSVSGGKMYAIKPERWDAYEGIEMERSAENTQLFQVIHIEGDSLRFQAYTVTGKLYDAFSVIKQPGEVNAFVSEIPDNTPTRTLENTMQYAPR